MLSTSSELTSGESKALKELQPTFNATGLEPFEVPPPDPNVQMPQVGDKVANIYTITPELAKALAAFLRKDHHAVLAALDAIENKDPGEHLAYRVFGFSG